MRTITHSPRFRRTTHLTTAFLTLAAMAGLAAGAPESTSPLRHAIVPAPPPAGEPLPRIGYLTAEERGFFPAAQSATFLDDGRIAAGAGSVLVILDTTGGQLHALGNATLTGRIQGLATAGDRVAAVTDRGLFAVLRVTAEGLPVVETTVTLAAAAYDVDWDGMTALVAASTAGLFIVDTSGPAAQVVSQWDSPGWAYGVARKGATIYLADGWEGIWVVNAGGLAPTPILQLPGNAMDLKVDGDHGYWMADGDGIFTVDLANPWSPVVLRHVVAAGYPYRACADANGLLHVASYFQTLTYTVSWPDLTLTSQKSAAGGYVLDVTCNHQYRAMVNGTAGLILEAGDASGFETLSVYRTPFRGGYPVETATGVLATNGADGLWNLDWPMADSDGTRLSLTGNAQRVARSGERLFVAADGGGVHVVSLAGSMPALEGTLLSGQPALGVTVRADRLFVSLFSRKVLVYDISAAGLPSLLAQQNTASEAYAADAFDGGFIVAETDRAELFVENGTGYALASTVTLPATAVHVHVARGMAYLSCQSAGVQILDVTHPFSPPLPETLPTAGPALMAITVGERIYVAEGAGGLGLYIPAVGGWDNIDHLPAGLGTIGVTFGPSGIWITDTGTGVSRVSDSLGCADVFEDNDHLSHRNLLAVNSGSLRARLCDAYDRDHYQLPPMVGDATSALRVSLSPPAGVDVRLWFLTPAGEVTASSDKAGAAGEESLSLLLPAPDALIVGVDSGNGSMDPEADYDLTWQRVLCVSVLNPVDAAFFAKPASISIQISDPNIADTVTNWRVYASSRADTGFVPVQDTPVSSAHVVEVPYDTQPVTFYKVTAVNSLCQIESE